MLLDILSSILNFDFKVTIEVTVTFIISDAIRVAIFSTLKSEQGFCEAVRVLTMTSSDSGQKYSSSFPSFFPVRFSVDLPFDTSSSQILVYHHLPIKIYDFFSPAAYIQSSTSTILPLDKSGKN